MNKQFKDDDLQARFCELLNKEIFVVRSSVQTFNVLLKLTSDSRRFFVINEFRLPVWYKPWTWFRRFLRVLVYLKE